MEESDQLHAPAALSPRVSASDTHWIGGWVDLKAGEEKNSQPLPRLESPIIQLVAQRYTSELSRLHC
jgi:hypothetical protein